MSGNSTVSSRSRKDAPAPKKEKPEKPYAGFPMFAHPAGVWAKKIKGTLHYFGSWRKDPEGVEALERLNREYPYLVKGEAIPPAPDDGYNVKDLCNAFVEAKEKRLNAGRISERTFRDAYNTSKHIVDFFGRNKRLLDIRASDFEELRERYEKDLGTISILNAVIGVRSVFKFAFKKKMIPAEIDYEDSFDSPSALELRKHRNQGGSKLFTRDEILRILDACDVSMKAMVLLGINCGFGNTDCSSLPLKVLTTALESGWLEFPRPKTAIRRRIPLWSETVEAIREAIDVRPKPKEKEADDLVFLTAHGRRWVRMKPKIKKVGETGHVQYTPIDALSPKFKKILKKFDINGRRSLGFYTLRHNFETHAGESKDQVAVDSVMGHVDKSMAGLYRESISDERLKAVTETVRVWLFEGGE